MKRTMSFPTTESMLLLSAVFALTACGGDSGSNAGEKLVAVSSIYNLGDCTKDFEGDTVFVRGEKADFVCLGGEWTNVDSLDSRIHESDEGGCENDESSSSRHSPLDGESSSSVILSGDSHEDSSDAQSSSSFVYEQNSSAYVQPEVLAIKDKSISGVSQKGPFVTGSAVKLFELNGKTYAQTGRSFTGKITSDSGTFNIPKISLESQYALLEANGYFRNEFTGAKSSGTITLNALTDLSSREKVNINLLTHLEYERALYLVNTGNNVPSAKKQAEVEILNAFGINGEFANSEDLDIFSKGDGNAALLAFSVLMLGELNEADLTERLTNFATDIEKDGAWNDEKTKARIADWAAILDLTDGKKTYERLQCQALWDEESGYNCVKDPNIYLKDEQNNIYKVVDQSSSALVKIRTNIENWNLGAVSDFEKFIRNFWYSVYGLGNCDTKSNAKVLATTNEHSTKYGTQVRFICKDGAWLAATDYEKDTYQWAGGTIGEIKKGNVTDSYYSFDGTKWIVAERENALGLCTDEKNGNVGKYNNAYYICKSKAWTTATVLEYDTYQFGAGEDGEVRAGRVNKSNYYVYENGAWRASANEIENNLGACVESRDGDRGSLSCDSYSSSSTCYYNYNGGGDEFYVCEFPNWKLVTWLEYQTYGLPCTNDGAIVNGYGEQNKFVCDADTIRYAKSQEIRLKKGCVSYILGDEYMPTGQLSHYRCETTGEWLFDKEKNSGTMIDSRDNQEYRTTAIGTQTWMAENLNYFDSINYPSMLGRNWCYKNSLDSCAKYGRLYTWAAAIDSVALYDGGNGVDCGYGKTCMQPSTVRGICPNGWHLPTQNEFDTLLIVNGSSSGKALRSQTGWYGDGNGTDAYGFSALPAGERSDGGYFSDAGHDTYLWTASGFSNSTKAYDMDMYYNRNSVGYLTESKNYGLSVRCVKD